MYKRFNSIEAPSNARVEPIERMGFTVYKVQNQNKRVTGSVTGGMVKVHSFISVSSQDTDKCSL